MTAPIEKVILRPAFTSRGDETVEAEVMAGGAWGRAAAPAGASAGEHEVRHLPPGGAVESVKNFTSRIQRMMGVDASDQGAITDALRDIDGTDDYSMIGGATAYAVSVASLESASRALGEPMYRMIGMADEPSMPLPLGNVLGGGKHAGRGSPDIQEFLVVPLDPPSVFDAVRTNFTVHRLVRRELERRDPLFPAGKGDEGAWAPRMKDVEALEVVTRAAEEAYGETGVRVGVGIDVAASTLWREGMYVYGREGRRLSREDQMGFIEGLIDEYGLMYVEDPLEEGDFDGFAELTRWAAGKGVLVTGDDLLVTKRSRLERAIAVGAGNAAILKVNQVGSLGEALKFAEGCHAGGYRIAASHRSGDTWDSHLAHIAVGVGAVMIKTGVVGGERVAKLMELIRIGEGLPGVRMASIT